MFRIYCKADTRQCQAFAVKAESLVHQDTRRYCDERARRVAFETRTETRMGRSQAIGF